MTNVMCEFTLQMHDIVLRERIESFLPPPTAKPQIQIQSQLRCVRVVTHELTQCLDAAAQQ